MKILYIVIIVLCFVLLYTCTCTDVMERFQTSKDKKQDVQKNGSKPQPQQGTMPVNRITLGMPAKFNDGVYAIYNYENTSLTSSAFTPIQCNNFEIGVSKPSPQKDWLLKMIDEKQAVYQLFKPTQNECLYAGIDNQLKSYFWNEANCGKRKNICGLEELNSFGELDEQSMPTYFKLVYNTDKTGVLIQSMDSKRYVSLSKDQVTMKDTPDLSCIFRIQRVQ